MENIYFKKANPSSRILGNCPKDCHTILMENPDHIFGSTLHSSIFPDLLKALIAKKFLKHTIQIKNQAVQCIFC